MNQISTLFDNYQLPKEKTKKDWMEDFWTEIEKEIKLTPKQKRGYAIQMNMVFKKPWQFEDYYKECLDYKQCNPSHSFFKRFAGGFRKQSWTN